MDIKTTHVNFLKPLNCQKKVYKYYRSILILVISKHTSLNKPIKDGGEDKVPLLLNQLT